MAVRLIVHQVKVRFLPFILGPNRPVVLLLHHVVVVDGDIPEVPSPPFVRRVLFLWAQFLLRRLLVKRIIDHLIDIVQMIFRFFGVEDMRSGMLR